LYKPRLSGYIKLVISYISASSLDYTLLDKKSKNRSQQICRHAVLLLTRSFTGKYLQYFLNLLKVSDHATWYP